MAGFGWFCWWFWLVLGGFVGGFGWFWVVLGGFGWFRVLVTTAEFCQSGSLAFHKYDYQGFLEVPYQPFNSFRFPIVKAD